MTCVVFFFYLRFINSDCGLLVLRPFHKVDTITPIFLFSIHPVAWWEIQHTETFGAPQKIQGEEAHETEQVENIDSNLESDTTLRNLLDLFHN